MAGRAAGRRAARAATLGTVYDDRSIPVENPKMNSRVFWALATLLGLFVVIGLILFEPNLQGEVDIQVLEQFYRHQYVLAVLIGALVGIVAAVRAPGALLHRPREAATDFHGRAIQRGLWSAFVAAVAALAGFLIYAAVFAMEPLAPLEKIIVVIQSPLFFVVLAIAALVSMLLYAGLTRSRIWGAQYALIKRF